MRFRGKKYQVPLYLGEFGTGVNINANSHSNDFTIDQVQCINVASNLGITTLDTPDTSDVNWTAGQTITFNTGSSLTTTTGNSAGNINLIANGQTTGLNNHRIWAYFSTISSNVLIGTSYADIIDGKVGNDNLNSSDGNDTLYGDEGNDILTGGAGADSLIGGNGSDYASYYRSATAIIVNLTTPSNNSRDTQGDTYDSIKNLQGSLTADSTLIGNK